MTKSIFFLFCLGWSFGATLAQSFAPFSMLITELMFDPSPSVQLPENEYVEFYNTTNDTISLKGWVWKVSDRSVVLPAFLLAPQESVIMIPKSSTDDYGCNTFYPDKWLTLPNSGQYLVLKDPSGGIIHFMSYSPGIFPDALKRAGGWSIELRSPEYPCSIDSWSVSKNPKGGSPGTVLFYTHAYHTIKAIKAMRVGYMSDNEAIIHLSDYLMPDTNPDQLKLAIGHDYFAAWTFSHDRTDQLHILFHDTLVYEAPFELLIQGTALSCSQVSLEPGSLKWGIPVLPVYGDILISEIMFNPTEDGLEYIELYNASDQIIDANSLIVSSLNDQGMIKDFSDSGSSSFLVFPGQFFVMTKDEFWLNQYYKSMALGSCHERKDLPNLVNSGGRIHILNQFQELIDEAGFDPDWHYSRIKDTKGISLERISFSKSGLLQGNWFSASAVSGYATPGEVNSQYSFSDDRGTQQIELINSVFSANHDGIQDQALIRFEFDKHGYVGQMEIRDLRGFLVRIVHPWGLLPKDGQIYWDGIDLQGRLAKDGIYVILFNYSHSDGESGRWKIALGLYHH